MLIRNVTINVMLQERETNIKLMGLTQLIKSLVIIYLCFSLSWYDICVHHEERIQIISKNTWTRESILAPTVEICVSKAT